MSTKGVIYDLHGVLIDSNPFVKEGWFWIADQLEYRMTDKQYEKIKDLPRREALDRILKWSYNRISEADKQQLMNSMYKMYSDALDGLTADDVMPGFKEMNSATRSKGIKTAVVSASNRAIKIIDKLDLVLDFDAIVDSRMIDEEPVPKGLLSSVLEKLQLSPREVAFVSTSAEGLRVAQTLGMRVYHFGTQSSSLVLQTIPNWKNAQIVSEQSA